MAVLQGTQRINETGHLEVGGCDTLALADEFGTPLYVLDEAAVRERCRAFRRAFARCYPNSSIAYAGKALLTLAVIRIVDEEGMHLDVASGGELFTALQAGFPPQRINLHGNYKSDDELRLALESGIARIVVDSMEEVGQLARLAAGHPQPVDVLLRLAPGVDPHTHGKISTGQDDTKFGMNVGDGSASAGVAAIAAQQWLRLRGFHAHVGSQLLDTEAHEAAADAVCRFVAGVRDQQGLTTEEIVLGGGLGIRYLPDQQPPSIDTFAATVTSAFCRALARYHLGQPHLGMEPGRSIVGESGLTLYTVGPIKHVPISEAPGRRTYVAVDGGLSDNPRPLMYEARYQALVANRAGAAPMQTVRVSGKHCETDTLLPAVDLPDVQPGDVLAVLSTGAYNYAMASNYNRFTRPAMVLVGNGRADLIVRRETWDDLVRCDVVPERLRKA
ncbi:MAG TPA: diaminopimelate decarboxylase [Chloroflexota bacterium]|jgi:diaminopimelate decarboxylase